MKAWLSDIKLDLSGSHFILHPSAFILSAGGGQETWSMSAAFVVRRTCAFTFASASASCWPSRKRAKNGVAGVPDGAAASSFFLLPLISVSFREVVNDRNPK